MILRALLAGVAVVVLGTIGGSSAAASGELQLSPDGTQWAGSLPAPLFDPVFRWVPGDQEVRTFYVRNDSGDAGLLTIGMLSGAVTQLMATGDVQVSVRVATQPWASVNSSSAQTLVQGASIAPGGTQSVQVRVTFDPGSTNPSQSKTLDLSFAVTLTQEIPHGSLAGNNGGPGANNAGLGANYAGPGANPIGVLPAGGSDVSPFTILIALALIGFGAVLASVGRRHPKDPPERQGSHA